MAKELKFDSYTEETLELWSQVGAEMRGLFEEIQKTFEKSGGKGVIFQLTKNQDEDIRVHLNPKFRDELIKLVDLDTGEFKNKRR